MSEQRRRPGIRRSIGLAVLIVLGSCSWGPSDGPVSNTENACTIIRERPHWYRAAKDAEARWGVPRELIFSIIWRESSFQAYARTRRTYFLGVIPTGRVSSAYGFAQAIDGTWAWYKKETGNGWADRDSFRDAADFVGWYTAKTRNSNGIPQTDAFNQYLAYHEGHAGYRRGTWRQKDWLQKAARDVARQTGRYRAQLAQCG